MNEARKIAIVALAILAIGLFALAVEWLRERINGWLVLILVSVVLLIMALSIHHAGAHDHNKPWLDGWYSGLKSGKGLCCGGPSVDATTLDGPDWETKDGHYRVRIEGQWVDVPDDAVVTEPNKDGRALVWPVFYRSLGAQVRIEIRCFMPGSMT